MKKILILLLLLSFVACGVKPMKLPTPQADSRDIVGHCSYTDGGFMLLWMIPINVNERLERAYYKCMNSISAESLTNIAVTDRWYFTPLGNAQVTTVEGDGVRRGW